MNVLQYATYCYAGYRGSMRFRFIRHSGGRELAYPIPRQTTMRATWKIDTVGDTVVTGTVNDAWEELTKTSWIGNQIAVQNSSDVLSFEVPFYSNQRFLTHEPDGSTPKLIAEVRLLYRNLYGSTVIYDEFAYEFHQATGDDFNVFFFLGVAPMWVRP
jgi:hypothetical protein